MRERVVFALLAACAAALLIFALAAFMKDPTSSYDFMVFYKTGTLLRHGLGSQLYHGIVQTDFRQHLFARTSQDVYNHPPFETLIYWALAYLPYPAAYVFWDLLNLIMLGCVLYLLRPFASHFDTDSRLTLTVAFLYPLISILREGQNEIVLLLACAGAFICLKKGREFAAGGLLGAGFFRFQLVLPLLLVFLALKRWRIILGAAATGAALTLLSLAVFGWAVIRDYIELVENLAKAGAFPLLVPAMPNVRGFVDVLLAGRVGPHYLTALAAAGSLALLAWPVLKWRRRRWDPGDKEFNLLFSLSVVACAMTSHYLLIHSLVVLLLPALLILDYTAGAHPKGFGRWRPLLPLNLLFLMTVFLNVEGRNRFGFLFVPILWLAFVISAEVPRARELAGGGERGNF